MEQSHQQIANDLPLDRLVARALTELRKLRYSRRSLRRYRTVWLSLAAFSRQTNLGGEYSEDLAARFCDAYRIRDGERVKPSEGWRRHIVFCVQILGDFARNGRIGRARTYMQTIQVPALMRKPRITRDIEVQRKPGGSIPFHRDR